jgi:hypothetical protein
MALFFPGMTCPLCHKPMDSKNDVIMFSPFVANRRDPLYFFSDIVMHRACFDRHDLAEAALQRSHEVYKSSGPGNRRCVVCGNEITDPDDYFGAGHLADDATDPLWSFNYVQLHRSHFKQWERASEFQKLAEKMIASPRWDGPHIVFDPAPVWKR